MIDEVVKEVVKAYTEHFGIPPPEVRVGCEGCPYYVNGRCSLGFIACYSPATDTITFSSPDVVKEEVILHELLHYAVDVRGGYLEPRGLPYGVSAGGSGGAVLAVAGALMLIASVAGRRW